MTKLRTKQAVMRRRMTLIFGPLVGVMLYVMARSIDSTAQRATDSFFFGNIENWPLFFRVGFMPLNLAATVAFCTLFSHVLLGVFQASDHNMDLSVRLVVKYLIGFFVGFGSLSATMITPTSGWYHGIEAFIIGGFVVTAVIAVFGVVFGLIFATYSFITSRKERILPVLRALPGAKLITISGRYFAAFMNAKDIPEPSDE